jgi:hypothetical protein
MFHAAVYGHVSKIAGDHSIVDDLSEARRFTEKRLQMDERSAKQFA